MNQGKVPSHPFSQVIQGWLAETKEDLKSLSILLNHDHSNLCKIANGKKEWIPFQTADKIVTVCTEGMGWRFYVPWLPVDVNLKLAEIYQSFDLEWLDEKYPVAA